MKQTIIAVILTLTLSSAAFATGDLGRSSVGVQIGFGKVDLGAAGDENTFSFGIAGTYATTKDPDLFGTDITLGYSYGDLDSIDTHNFGVTATPFLNISQYFRPYANVGIGYFSWDAGAMDDSNFAFKLGIGIEMEFVTNWSTSISYDHLFVDDFDTGTFGIGTGYWFESGIGIDIRYEHSEIDVVGGDVSTDGVTLGAGYSF